MDDIDCPHTIDGPGNVASVIDGSDVSHGSAVKGGRTIVEETFVEAVRVVVDSPCAVFFPTVFLYVLGALDGLTALTDLNESASKDELLPSSSSFL